MATHANEPLPPINMKLLWEQFRGGGAPPAAPVDTRGVAPKVDDTSLQVTPEEIDQPKGAPSSPPSPVPVDELDPEEAAAVPTTSGAWTIPMLCAGLAVIACTLLIPQADANRRLVYEREKLVLDLQHIEKQIAVNDDFLHKLNEDPTLAERLAQRQMKVVREGTSVLQLKEQEGSGRDLMSPYLLISVPPPAPMPPYQPVGGGLANFCRHPKSQLYLTGLGLMLMASGLVLGFSKGK